MYEEFFGLTERPFELTPNPRYLCLTPQHREALSTLKYGLTTARGITLLLGEAGTGKTTLIRSAINSELRNDAVCVYLTNPTFSRTEFIRYLAEEFGLSRDAATSKTVLLRELSRFLHVRRQIGAITTLVLDEAQSLPYELLEEVRLLANLETDDDKLLPVVLTGQPEFADRLNEPSLRQLKQRIALRCALRPLNLDETAAYIVGRLRVAGSSGHKTFTRQAVEAIYERSGGIPRVVSVICDNALLAGFASGVRPVTLRMVTEVCDDFDLNAAASQRLAAAPRARPVDKFVSPSDAADGAKSDAVGSTLFETVEPDRRWSIL